MSINFTDFSRLAEENPEQYAELLYALKQTYNRIELEMAQDQALTQIKNTGITGGINSAEAEARVVGNYGTYTAQIGTRLSGNYGSGTASVGDSAIDVARAAYEEWEGVLEQDASGRWVTKAQMGAVESSPNSGVYETVPLLSMDLGVVGAAVAPLLGVALGVGLYESNPEFWTRLSMKLLPFCYPGTTEIPTWLDVKESLIPGKYETQALIDRRVLDAINDLFVENGYGIPGRKHNINPVTINGQTISGPTACMSAPTGRETTVGVTNRGGSFTITPWGQNTLVTYFRDSGVTLVCSTSQNWTYDFDKRDAVGNIYAHGFNGLQSPSSYTYQNKTVYYRTDNSSDVTLHTAPTSVAGDADLIGLVAWYLMYGLIWQEIPEGSVEWSGEEPSTIPYSKPVIIFEEDPENPGHFIPQPHDAVGVAVPSKSHDTGRFEYKKPDNWPEDVEWPLETDFPWNKPDGYEGEWPSKMPWPLPPQKPDWWPDIIPYPDTFPSPNQSVDPDDNPNPNKNSAEEPASENLPDSSLPDTTTDPSNEPTPDPDIDPSGGEEPSPSPTPQLPVVPPIVPPASGTPAPPGGVEPPPDDGSTPTPVLPDIDPPFTSANDGLITVYHPTDAELKAFSSWLWVTYADPTIDKLWNNPFDGVIGLMEIYCTPTDNGRKNIRSGFLDSGVNSATISRYTEIDCGSIFIPEVYGNYLDYSPYSKCHAYLPFIGIVELNIDDIVDHGINISYKIDEYNGACIAQITCAKYSEYYGEEVTYNAVTYQFSGNCAVELPLAGGTQSAIRAGLIQAAAYGLSSVIGGIANGVMGNISGGISQVASGAASALGAAVSAKSSVQHSGSFGSSYGALGIKKPYLIVSRPKQIDIINYNDIYGYPAHSPVTIGTCNGYLRVREVHVKSATASNEEKKLIEQLLKEGVYVNE